MKSAAVIKKLPENVDLIVLDSLFHLKHELTAEHPDAAHGPADTGRERGLVR
jgi:hypothetical protein